MQHMKHARQLTGMAFTAACAVTAAVFPGAVAQPVRTLTPPIRLYVLDGGTLEGGDIARFQLTREEVATTDMSVASYLIVHPRGTLAWDAGAVPDADLRADRGPTRHRVVLPGGQERFVTTASSLASQLIASGHMPDDITFLVLSHYHYDHTANANLFFRSTWLVRQVERDAMFARTPTPLTQPSSYSALERARTTIVRSDDYDVFGDGSVVVKYAPGHTPGHQVLFVRLPKTGPVLLSGDLYHYPEERTLHRVPTFDANPAQTGETRVAIDGFLQKSGAQLWIQHDIRAHARLKKAPLYYD